MSRNPVAEVVVTSVVRSPASPDLRGILASRWGGVVSGWIGGCYNWCTNVSEEGTLLIVAFIGTLILTWVYASFFEWFFHRFVMHRVAGPLRHIYKGHAQIHHGVYQGDRSYVAGDRNPEEVTFGWWLMPVVPLAHVPHAVGLYFLFGLPSAFGLMTGVILYQVIYEYLHFCMHVPQKRWIERRSGFRWVSDHHLQHHRKNMTNLNVFFPLADFVLRTRRVCQSPGSVAIINDVGYLPEHRRQTRSEFFRKAGRESRWLVEGISRRLIKIAVNLVS